MYQRIIESFRDGSLIYKIDDIDVNEYIQNKPDPFEAYMLAKFCQLDNVQNKKLIKHEFEKAKKDSSYKYFFSYIYRNNIKNYFKPKGSIPLENYVPLEIESVIFEDNNRYYNTINEIITSFNKIVITGESGSGKTFSLENLLLQSSENNSLIEGFPILIRLDGVNPTGIYSQINRFINKYNGAINFETIRNYFPKEYLVFLFDGLDEIANLNMPTLTEVFNRFITEFNSKVVITTRPLLYFKNEKLLDLPTFKILKLTENQKKLIITNYFNYIKSTNKINALEYSLRHNTRFSELADNPLLLTLICINFSKNEKIPENESDVYDNFINEIEVRDWHREYSEAFKIPFITVRKILEHLAYEMYQCNLVNFDMDLFCTIIKNELKDFNPLKVIDEILRRGFLRLSSESDLKYDFIHKSWQKYFAACYLKGKGKPFLLNKIREMLDNTKWDEVLLILVGICKDEDIIKEIAKWDMLLASKCIGIDKCFENTIDYDLIIKLKEKILDEDENLYFRLKAIDCIGEMKSENSINCLKQLLNHNNKNIRSAIANALGTICSEQSLDPLIKLLDDKDFDVFESAVKALIKVGTEKALLAIIKSLFNINDLFEYTIHSSMDIDVAIDNFWGKVNFLSNISEAIWRIDSNKIMECLYDILKNNNEDAEKRSIAAKIMGLIKSDKSLNMLIELLNCRNKKIRTKAIEGLSFDGSDKAVEALINSLNDKDKDIHKSLVFYMKNIISPYVKNINSEKVVNALINCLDDKNKDIRLYALHSLNENYSEKAVDALINLLKDKNEEICRRSAYLLGHTKSDKAVEALIKSLKSQNTFFVKIVIEALGKIGSEKALNALIPFLKSENADIFEETVSALGFMHSEKAIAPLVHAFKRIVLSAPDKTLLYCYRDSIILSLEFIRTDKAVDALIDLMNIETELYVKEKIIDAIKEIKSEKAVNYLIKLFEDKKNALWISVTCALGYIKSEKAINVLIDSLNHTGENEYDIIYWIINALSDTGSDMAVDALKNLLFHKNTEIVSEVIDALKKIGSDKSICALNECINEQDDDYNIWNNIILPSPLGFIFKSNTNPISNKSVRIVVRRLKNIYDKAEYEIKEEIFSIIESLKEYYGERFLDILKDTDLLLCTETIERNE